jgi:hypothetical protein
MKNSFEIYIRLADVIVKDVHIGSMDLQVKASLECSDEIAEHLHDQIDELITQLAHERTIKAASNNWKQ